MDIRDIRKTKKIKTDIKQLEKEISFLKDEQSNIMKRMSEKRKQIEEYQKLIKKTKIKYKKKGGLIITEHLILRYLERVEKIDLNEIIENIITDSVLEQYRVLGDGVYSILDGSFKIVIRNRRVITIIENKKKEK